MKIYKQHDGSYNLDIIISELQDENIVGTDFYVRVNEEGVKYPRQKGFVTMVQLLLVKNNAVLDFNVYDEYELILVEKGRVVINVQPLSQEMHEELKQLHQKQEQKRKFKAF